MKRVDYPEPLHALIRALRKLPGVGPRSAERLALWMLAGHRDAVENLASSMIGAVTAIRPCRRCGFFAENDVCRLCEEQDRNREIVCVVEQPTDVIPIERTGVYKGLYHSLGGKISPLDHIGPEDLAIEPLLTRVRDEGVKEVILALGADVEGEATASYLRELLRPLGVSLTRIAQGISAGMGLEHADELTLSRALSGRVQI